MLSVAVLLVIVAFILVILAAIGKAPLWIAVLILIVERMITVLPAGR